MSSSVDTIKEKLDVAEVIGSYVKLEKAGANFKARCPFHNEKTPSFFISPSRGSYYCFGCGAKGDMFTFVEEFEGVDFMGALKVLAARAGVELVHENPKTKSERDRLFSAVEHAAVFFQQNVDAPGVKAYLSSRGIQEQTIRDWRIGFVTNDWRTLYTFLRSKNFTDSEIEKAGLSKKTDKGYYDRFRGRIMFPIFDTSGRVIGFSGRIFGTETKDAPKYLNSPDTSLFNKSDLLYGLHVAKNEIRKKGYSILVEGQMDLILTQQAKFGNTVATSGTALTLSQITRLKRLSPRIIMAFDPDEAGLRASFKNAELALANGMEVKVATLPKGQDPADLVVSDIENWKTVLKNSKHLIDFALDRVLSEEKDKRKQGKQISARILPYIAMLDSRVEQSHFISEISEKAHIKEDALWDDLKRVKIETKESPPSTVADKKSLRERTEEEVISILMWQESVDKPEVPPDKIKKEFIDIVGQKYFDEIYERHSLNKIELIAKAEQTASPPTRTLEDLLASLRKNIVKAELQEIQSILREAERANDTAGTEKILKLYNEKLLKK
ncbi:DNA primase [Candidatus Parcubacteria bacterium]|nr:DNA primase [Candidatus Parcubacteria bacterium]